MRTGLLGDQTVPDKIGALPPRWKELSGAGGKALVPSIVLDFSPRSMTWRNNSKKSVQSSDGRGSLPGQNSSMVFSPNESIFTCCLETKGKQPAWLSGQSRWDREVEIGAEPPEPLGPGRPDLSRQLREPISSTKNIKTSSKNAGRNKESRCRKLKVKSRKFKRLKKNPPQIMFS